MSRKLDWAVKEARILALALGVDSDNETAKALIAATLKLAYQRGVGEGIDRTAAGVDAAFAKYAGGKDGNK